MATCPNCGESFNVVVSPEILNGPVSVVCRNCTAVLYVKGDVPITWTVTNNPADFDIGRPPSQAPSPRPTENMDPADSTNTVVPRFQTRSEKGPD
jgi:hypothetical protein